MEIPRDDVSGLEFFEVTPVEDGLSFANARLIDVDLIGELTSSRSTKLTLRATFLPIPIKTGVVVVVECYIGITGAHFLLKANGAGLNNLTPDVHILADHKIEEQVERKRSFSPSVTAKKIEVSLGSIDAKQNISRQVSFSSGEAILQGVIVKANQIKWSLRPHAGIKFVTGYLEGNLDLVALGSWDGEILPRFYAEAEPSDRRFFGPDGKILSRLASLGLWIKLLIEGVELPSYGAIKKSLALRRPGHGK